MMMLVTRKHTLSVKGQKVTHELEAGDDDVRKLRVLQPFSRHPFEIQFYSLVLPTSCRYESRPCLGLWVGRGQ